MADDRLAEVQHESLEDQREFLLRSLDDLDSELVAGNIDPDTYRVLHDDYTARAAAVIKTIADGVQREASSGAKAPSKLRFVTIGGIVVFALLAAFLLAHSAGQRRPGQTITGNNQVGGSATPTTLSTEAVIQAARAVATAQPKSYDARVNYARTLFSAGPQYFALAVQEYIAASQLNPKQPEPFAYAGWLSALLSRGETNAANRKLLLDTAERSLDQAMRVDPTYPDSYVFKGLILTQIENKQCQGAIAFEEYLVRAPAGDPMRSEVLNALAQAVKAGNCPSPSTTPTTKP